MNDLRTKQAGFGMVQLLFVAFLGTVVIAALVKNMGSLYQSDSDLTLRADFRGALQKLSQRVDCDATLQGVDLTTIPAGGQPIALKSFPSGDTLIPEDGGNIGKFSFLADLQQNQTITIRAAWLAASTSNPRSLLTAGDDSFRRHPMLKRPWNWAFSKDFINANMPTLGSLCGTSVAAAGAGGISVACEGDDPNINVLRRGMHCVVFNASNGVTCEFPTTIENERELTRQNLSNAVPVPGTIPVEYKHAGVIPNPNFAQCLKVVSGNLTCRSGHMSGTVQCY